MSDDAIVKNLQEMVTGNDWARVALPRFADFDPIIVEFSSPNIAKPFSIGHLRSTIIGDAVARMLAFNGIKVIKDNHLGDWGTQFGKLSYALMNWSDMETVSRSKEPLKELVKLYVRFHEEAEKNPELDDEARDLLKKLEDKDPELLKIWEFCVEISLKDFARVYDRLDVAFDTQLGESFFLEFIPEVVNALKDKHLLVESEGAQVVMPRDEKLPPAIIFRTDGASVYITRDLAADWYRLREYGSKVLVINEVGNEQILHFSQLYEIEDKVGWFKKDQRIHLRHGLYRFNDGKMSTREGKIIWMDEILDEAINRASAINEKSAVEVGIGAVKWNDLKNEAIKDIVFDWEQVLALKGNTGPYIQYTVARARKLVSKSSTGQEIVKLNPSDRVLGLKLLQFRDELTRSSEKLAPHLLCQHLFSVSQAYNEYYENGKLIGTEREEVGSALSQIVANQLALGLDLLGIKIPPEM